MAATTWILILVVIGVGTDGQPPTTPAMQSYNFSSKSECDAAKLQVAELSSPNSVKGPFVASSVCIETTASQ